MSARIAGIATALPENEFSQEQARAVLERWYEAAPPDPPVPLETARRAYANAGVKTRYAAIPIERLLPDSPLRNKNRLYMESALALSERVVSSLFAHSPLSVEDVDLIITTSCTGFMIPSLDAHLINRCGFRADVRRIPVTELGCAAGVSALRIAADHIRGFPGATVLILAVELTTLTFQPSDFSGAHVISTAIFGDGAAGALVTGRDLPGLEIERTGTHFFKNTLDFMGFDLRETGFHIFLSPRIPAFIRDDLVPELHRVLDRDPVSGSVRWLVHPGGAKILNAAEDALGLERGALTESRSVLNRVGNLSSATIFFIIEEYMNAAQLKADGETAGVLAVGPGFSLDYAFLKTTSSSGTRTTS